MIDSYVIVVSKLQQGGWLAQLCYSKEVIAEVTRSTQLNAIMDVRREAEPWFVRCNKRDN